MTDEGLFRKACSNRMRCNGFKLEQGRFGVGHHKEVLYNESDKIVGKVAQGCA